MTVYFVAAVAASLIYYIGKDVVGSFAHLSDESLAYFWSGEMQRTNQKRYRQATEHLASCDNCRQRLDEIRKHNPGPGSADPMIDRRY